MRRGQQWLLCCLGLAMFCSTTGCLSLGGSTTYVHEKPETVARVTALETRVGALEQAFGPAQAYPPAPAPNELTTESLSDQ